MATQQHLCLCDIHPAELEIQMLSVCVLRTKVPVAWTQLDSSTRTVITFIRCFNVFVLFFILFLFFYFFLPTQILQEKKMVLLFPDNGNSDFTD